MRRNVRMKCGHCPVTGRTYALITAKTVLELCAVCFDERMLKSGASQESL